MILIGISGKKAAGKDVVASFIQQQLNPMSYQRIAFADALKNEVSFGMHVSVEYIEQHKDNFRLILQGWGTDYRRKLCGADYWTKQWLYLVNRSHEELIIAPDCRFLNEIQMIKRMNGFTIRIDRPSTAPDSHSSECELDDYQSYDYYIRNDSSLQQLKLSVNQIVQSIRNKHDNRNTNTPSA